MRTEIGGQTPDRPPRRLSREIRFSFSSTPEAVRRALATVMDGLDTLGLDELEAGAVELVLAEVLNNVVEHAYGSGAVGWIQVTCGHDPSGLRMTIRDRGAPMPDGQLPLQRLAEPRSVASDIPEGGFGWFIIRDLARDIEYRREDGVNILGFRMAVGLPMLRN